MVCLLAAVRLSAWRAGDLPGRYRAQRRGTRDDHGRGTAATRPAEPQPRRLIVAGGLYQVAVDDGVEFVEACVQPPRVLGGGGRDLSGEVAVFGQQRGEIAL